MRALLAILTMALLAPLPLALYHAEQISLVTVSLQASLPRLTLYVAATAIVGLPTVIALNLWATPRVIGWVVVITVGVALAAMLALTWGTTIVWAPQHTLTNPVTPQQYQTLVVNFESGFAVVLTLMIQGSLWLLGNRLGTLLALFLVWAPLIAFNPSLPTTPQTLAGMTGLAIASLATLALGRAYAQRRQWVRSRTQIVASAFWPLTQTLSGLGIVVMALALLLPQLAAAQSATLTASLAQARARLQQTNPLVLPGQHGPPLSSFGTLDNHAAPTTPSNPILLRYSITRAPKGAPTAPRLDVVALAAVSDSNVWTVAPFPSEALAANTVITSPTYFSSATDTVGRITLLHAIAGNYLPAFETATQFSVQVEAQSLASTNANASATANHPTTLLIQNPQAPGAPTLPMTYSVTSAALVSSGAPFPFSVTTFSTLTATPPSLTAQLRATARAWAGQATDAQSEAIAIQAAMQRQLRLTPINPRVTGVASVQTLLTTHRGDAFAWDTTYALLLRALGVPTRLMEGLLPGAYDPHTAEQVVRQSNATYWPQVAVDGSCWLTFDPTATVLPVSSATQTTNGGKVATSGTSGAQTGAHSGAHPAARTPQRPATPPVTPPIPRPLQPLAHTVGATGAWLLVVAVALLILCAALLIWRTTIRHKPPTAHRAARPIRLLVGWARFLGVRFAPGETTQQALARIARLSARPGAPADVTVRLVAMSNNARWLAYQYNHAVYAPRPTFEVATVARTDRLARAFGILLLRARLRGFAHPLADASASTEVALHTFSPVSFSPER